MFPISLQRMMINFLLKVHLHDKENICIITKKRGLNH